MAMAKVGPNPALKLRQSADLDDGATEYHALKELSQNVGPLGCWRIRGALQVAGIQLSEATAGRLLRQLDLEGYTQPVGSKGRLLTERGRRRLADLEQARARTSSQKDLWQAIHVERLEDVLDVLAARRLIEAETARLAALLASEEEIAELERAVVAHIAEVRAGQKAGALNRSIHRLIAQASRSHVLQAIASLIVEDGQLHNVQLRVQRASGARGLAPEEHAVILKAIKDRRPAEAAEAMCTHIDRIIRVVRTYHATHGQQRSHEQ